MLASIQSAYAEVSSIVTGTKSVQKTDVQHSSPSQWHQDPGPIFGERASYAYPIISISASDPTPWTYKKNPIPPKEDTVNFHAMKRASITINQSKQSDITVQINEYGSHPSCSKKVP